MSSLVNRDHRAIAIWLLICALLVVCMVMLGGYTRLSGSGLSMTSWKPVHGIIPPLSQEAWQEEFAGYKASPQYQQVNYDMELEGFKSIFWPEFLHRALGRIMGLTFALPLLFFMCRHSLSKRFSWRLAGIFALGGVQGIIGWLMVKSGLVDMPRVSHLRLALHLGLALMILSFIIWAFLDVIRPIQSKYATNRPMRWYQGWLLLFSIQLILGAFMAGLQAGLIYNSYPTMNGQWIPEGLFSITPLYKNFLDNVTMVQWLHRTLAIVIILYYVFWWYFNREYIKVRGVEKASQFVHLIIVIQFALGVLTLLHMAPLWLALSHQMVAVLLLAVSVWLLHGLTYKKETVE